MEMEHRRQKGNPEPKDRAFAKEALIPERNTRRGREGQACDENPKKVWKELMKLKDPEVYEANSHESGHTGENNV
jgi:hypothetical protein